MSQNFIHLRVHTRYSIGEGTLYIHDKKDANRETITKLCKKFNMPAVAVTDTNIMSSAAEFSSTAPGNGIQPIIGLVASFNHHENADPKILRADGMSKIVLLVQNQTGWTNLCKLNSLMYMRRENSHLGPYITWDELATLSDGLICLSGGTFGPIGDAILNNQDNLAREFATRFQKIFGDKFYMELQRHGLRRQIKTEPEFLTLASELNIPIVATNDVCFASPEDYEAKDAYGCVLQQTKVIEPDRKRKNSEQYFKSPAEMIELFNDLPEAIANTNVIAQRCAFMVNTNSDPLLPRFASSFEEDCKILREDSRAGLGRRMAENKVDPDAQKKYYEQLDFENDVIINMGFPAYMLIVADYINWCKKNDILVGPGRGSGAGSVVAWALGITNVDPLEYGLLFERFLNPDRISVPDFDVDFEPAGLPRVEQYIAEKYGSDNVCRIITFGSLQARGAIRDIGRVYGLPYSKTDRFAKLIPSDAKKIKDAVKSSYEIQELLDMDEDLRKVIDISMEIEGAYRNLGQHACGYVIGDKPITHIAPLYRDPGNEMPSVQFDMDNLESAGLIKFDFLGLETLTVLKNASKMILENFGTNIDLDEIPLEDKTTFDKIWRPAKTVGVFQYDGSALPWLRQMKPTKFAHIVALNALNRPGPMQYIPQFIRRLNKEEDVQYVHPSVEQVLQETYGIVVYQEQVMQLSRTLAGFSRGESDTLRKGMGKKIFEVMDKMRVKFVDGCVAQNTLSRDQAEDLYAQFMKFAEYAFNKAHSVCYSVIAAQCAYLKAHYPAEFLAASMSSNMGDSDQLAIFIDDAKSNFGLEIIAPNVNESESLFAVKNGKIIFGLAAIKGVGIGATDAIIAERTSGGKFQNITDFAKRCAPFINKRIIEAFAKVGTFDSLIPNRAQIYMNTDLIINYAAKSRDAGNTLSLFEDSAADDAVENRLQKQMTNIDAWGFGEQLTMEHSVLGYYLSAHPLDQYKKIIWRKKLFTSETLAGAKDRQVVQIAACINSAKRRTTKAGKPMMQIKASDSAGDISDVVVFGDSVAAVAPVLEKESIVLLTGRAAVRDDSVSVFVDRADALDNWVAANTAKLTLDITRPESLPELKKIIDTLPRGHTKIIININGAEKSVTISLPNSVTLPPTIMGTIAALGIRAVLE